MVFILSRCFVQVLSHFRDSFKGGAVVGLYKIPSSTVDDVINRNCVLIRYTDDLLI